MRPERSDQSMSLGHGKVRDDAHATEDATIMLLESWADTLTGLAVRNRALFVAEDKVESAARCVASANDACSYGQLASASDELAKAWIQLGSEVNAVIALRARASALRHMFNASGEELDGELLAVNVLSLGLEEERLGHRANAKKCFAEVVRLFQDGSCGAEANRRALSIALSILGNCLWIDGNRHAATDAWLKALDVVSDEALLDKTRHRDVLALSYKLLCRLDNNGDAATLQTLVRRARLSVSELRKEADVSIYLRAFFAIGFFRRVVVGFRFIVY